MGSCIRGVGIDVVEIERVRSILERRGEKFLARLLTSNERMEVGNPPKSVSVAARFAAKEAVAKAMGTGIRGFSFHDIEVRRGDLGAPYVILHGGAFRRAQELGVDQVWISLSHERSVAVATAVLEGNPK